VPCIQPRPDHRFARGPRLYKRRPSCHLSWLSPPIFASGKSPSCLPVQPPLLTVDSPPHRSSFIVRRSKGGTTPRGSSRTCRNHLSLAGAPPPRSPFGELPRRHHLIPFFWSQRVPHVSSIVQDLAGDLPDAAMVHDERHPSLSPSSSDARWFKESCWACVWRFGEDLGEVGLRFRPSVARRRPRHGGCRARAPLLPRSGAAPWAGLADLGHAMPGRAPLCWPDQAGRVHPSELLHAPHSARWPEYNENHFSFPYLIQFKFKLQKFISI
jgi:hypothetical protein